MVYSQKDDASRNAGYADQDLPVLLGPSVAGHSDFITSTTYASPEEAMKRKPLSTIPCPKIALVMVLAAAFQTQAQDAKTPYPNMAPLDQYLMERNAEIALARSAAPEAVSKDAEVMVLGRHGYEIAV